MKYKSPRCTRCGERYAKAIASGADVDGNQLRERRCDCGQRYTTIEIALPSVKFSEIDVVRREYQKMWRRAKTGYQGKRGNHQYAPPIRLIIEVKKRVGIFADTILRLDGSNVDMSKRNVEAAPIDQRFNKHQPPRSRAVA